MPGTIPNSPGENWSTALSSDKITGPHLSLSLWKVATPPPSTPRWPSCVWTLGQWRREFHFTTALPLPALFSPTVLGQRNLLFHRYRPPPLLQLLDIGTRGENHQLFQTRNNVVVVKRWRERISKSTAHCLELKSSLPTCCCWHACF
jgi:hypothetical protein